VKNSQQALEQHPMPTLKEDCEVLSACPMNILRIIMAED